MSELGESIQTEEAPTTRNRKYTERALNGKLIKQRDTYDHALPLGGPLQIKSQSCCLTAQMLRQ